MAGVAEAMAASSMLLETGSVASSASQSLRPSEEKKFSVARTCICRLGDDCARMSAAFRMAKDARGDFVVLPRELEGELRSAFYRYLRPDESAFCENVKGGKEDIMELEVVGDRDSYNGVGINEDDQSYDSQGSNGSRGSCDSRASYDSQGSHGSRGSCDSGASYDSQGSRGSNGSRGSSSGSSGSERSGNDDDRSYDSRGSHTDSQGSYDSRDSRGSCGSQGSYDSRASRDSGGSQGSDDDDDDRGSYDSQGSDHSHRSYDSRRSDDSRDGSQGRYDDVSVGSDHTKDNTGRREGRNRQREEAFDRRYTKENTDIEEHKKVCKIEHDVDFGIEIGNRANRNADDCDRSVLSEVSHEDEGIEEYVAAHHFHPKVIHRYFDICLERRPEDDLIPLFITTMSAEERRACGMPIEDDECDRVVNPVTGAWATDHFWVVPSYSLDSAHEDWRQLMRSRLRSQDINSASARRTAASSESQKSASDDTKWKMAYALAQQMMEQKPPSAPRETESVGEQSAHSTISSKEKLKTSKVSANASMGSHLPPSSLTPKVISATASMKVRDQTASVKSRAEKDDLVPISHPIEKHSHPPEPSDSLDDESDSQLSYSKSDCSLTPSSPPPPLQQKGIATAKKPTGSAEPMQSKSAAITNAETSPFRLMACCLFLGLMATVTLHCAEVLISREGAMAPEVPFYVESLNAMARSSTTYIKEVAVELPPVKAVDALARTTQNFIYATPPETQMLILVSILWSACDRAMSSVKSLWAEP